MAISVFDLFKSGIGPSSSHTVGPMIAAGSFAESVSARSAVHRIKAELFGSLGATGKGHGSDTAILLGLEGEHPKHVDVDNIPSRLSHIRSSNTLTLPGGQAITFDESTDLVMHKRKSLPFHPNAMTFSAYNAANELIEQRTYYSVGGGFVIDEDASSDDAPIKEDSTELPYAFTTGDRLLELCKAHNMSFCDIMMANESVWRSKEAIHKELLELWDVMQACVKPWLRRDGYFARGYESQTPGK